MLQLLLNRQATPQDQQELFLELLVTLEMYLALLDQVKVVQFLELTSQTLWPHLLDQPLRLLLQDQALLLVRLTLLRLRLATELHQQVIMVQKQVSLLQLHINL